MECLWFSSSYLLCQGHFQHSPLGLSFNTVTLGSLSEAHKYLLPYMTANKHVHPKHDTQGTESG